MINLFCIRPKGFNIGNDAIHLGLQRFLYDAFPGVVNIISVPATSRYESHAKAGLTARTVHEINQYGHGVIVGGGNLYENGELEVDFGALEALEVPMMLFSLSAGRIYNRQQNLVRRTDAMSESVIRALHQKADISLARDAATVAYLRSLGCDNVELGGCPTLFLNELVSRLPALSDRDRAEVLISLRNPQLMNIPLSRRRRVYEDIPKLVTWLRDEGFKDVRFLCHDHRDIEFASLFSGVDFIYTDDVHTYLGILRHCRLNVSYRLHASIPCMAFGVPTIKISYDERALSLMETLGFDEWNINLLQTDNLCDAVADRYHRLDVLAKIRDAAHGRWEATRETMTSAFARFANAAIAMEGSSFGR